MNVKREDAPDAELTWCDPCGEAFPVDHEDDNYSHRVGREWGSTGLLLAAHEIAHALAASHEPRYIDRMEDASCVLCAVDEDITTGTIAHAADCPWLRARQLYPDAK